MDFGVRLVGTIQGCFQYFNGGIIFGQNVALILTKQVVGVSAPNIQTITIHLCCRFANKKQLLPSGAGVHIDGCPCPQPLADYFHIVMIQLEVAVTLLRPSMKYHRHSFALYLDLAFPVQLGLSTRLACVHGYPCKL